MKVKVVVELDIDEKQYDETYADFHHVVDSSTMELIKTASSNKKMLQAMKEDILANAQFGVLEWAKRLSFDINIKNNIIE